MARARRRHVQQSFEYRTRGGKRRGAGRKPNLSIQGNHLHLIVEADSRRALSKGLQGFQVSVAKQINHRLRRKGQVFADRFHARALKTPTEVRNGIRYVLANARRHGITFAGRFDPYSTAHQFAGWRECPDRIVDLRREKTLPTKLARTWLLEHGWKRLPLASAYDVPGPAR